MHTHMHTHTHTHTHTHAQESWLSVDGEGYEAVPMRVRVLPYELKVLSPHTAGITTANH